MMTNVVNTLSVTLLADELSLRQRTDQLVQPYLDNGLFVGMSIGVLDRGQRQTFGYGRLSQDDPRVPDGDTIYEFGSASKVLTGLLLADAVVQGRVSWISRRVNCCLQASRCPAMASTPSRCKTCRRTCPVCPGCLTI